MMSSGCWNRFAESAVVKLCNRLYDSPNFWTRLPFQLDLLFTTAFCFLHKWCQRQLIEEIFWSNQSCTFIEEVSWLLMNMLPCEKLLAYCCLPQMQSQRQKFISKHVFSLWACGPGLCALNLCRNVYTKNNFKSTTMGSQNIFLFYVIPCNSLSYNTLGFLFYLKDISTLVVYISCYIYRSLLSTFSIILIQLLNMLKCVSQALARWSKAILIKHH